MARKSNKTSHVLHLLAGEEPIEETPEVKEETTKSQEPELQEPVTEQESEPETPNISIVSARNSEGDPLADLIREQLEENFPEEILNTASTSSDEPEPVFTSGPPEADNSDNYTAADDAPPAKTDDTEEPEAIPSAEPAQNEAAKPSDTTPAQNETEEHSDAVPTQNKVEEHSDTTSVQTKIEENQKEHPHTDDMESSQSSSEIGKTSPSLLDSVAAQPSSAADTSSSTHYRFVNVMEYIIKDSVLDQMKKFDMCTCERCQVDTIALALTSCPAKYIVVDNHTVSPLLNYYANKFMGTVTVELIKACTIVKENPRH